MQQRRWNAAECSRLAFLIARNEIPQPGDPLLSRRSYRGNYQMVAQWRAAGFLAGMLSLDALALLDAAAQTRRMSVLDLAGSILATVLRDGLVAAVLDDGSYQHAGRRVSRQRFACGRGDHHGRC